MKKASKITAIIPVYNAEKYIAEAIKSVLLQTYLNFELLIINDCSTDGSVDVILSFQDPRIRVIHNTQNMGLAGVRNLALKESKSELVAWLDADDQCSPDRFAKQVMLFEQNPRLAICGSWFKTFGETADIKKQTYPLSDPEIRVNMLFSNCFATSSVMFRHSIAVANNLRFEEKFPPAEDYVFWYALMQYGDVINIAEFLVDYRIHESQSTNNDNGERRKAEWYVQANILSTLGVIPREDEKKIHLKIGARSEITLNELPYVEAWLRKLIQSNQNESVVKPKVFNEVIGEVWHRVCYAITCQKNIVRMKSLNSEVGQAFKPGLFYYLKFHFRNIQTRINQLFKES